MEQNDLPQDKLNKREQNILDSSLSSGEKVLGTCIGAYGQAVIATSYKVLIIKCGLMAGQTFGGKVTSFNYENINSVEVQMGVLSGVFEIATGGIQGYERSRWSSQKNGANESPNTVPYNRQDKEKFQKMATYIRGHVAIKDKNVKDNTIDIPEQIQKLDELRNKGILTKEEFEKKKAELLARL